MKEENSLVFQVSHLSQGENRFELEADIEELDLGNFTFLEPLLCMILLELTGERVDASIRLKTGVEITCSRCSQVIRQDIDAEVKITFIPRPEKSEEGGDIEAMDLEFYDEKIELGGVARDTFMLALPIAPLCFDDCKGLCPSCGTNLNQATCKCFNEPSDSPFGQLRRIVEE